MAKIHNPQDQEGISLVNKTIFDTEVSRLDAADIAETKRAEAAEAEIAANLAQEILDRKQAVEDEARTRQNADETEYNRAVERENEIDSNLTKEISDRVAAVETEAKSRNDADIELQTAIQEEAGHRINADAVLNLAIETEGSERARVDGELRAAIESEQSARELNDSDLDDKIIAETERATEAEIAIMSCVNVITGHSTHTTLTSRPATAVEVEAMEIKGTVGLSNVVGKKIKVIEFAVDNTVSTPHYLAIYKTSGSTKTFIAVSEPTIWSQGESAKFIFNTSFTIDGTIEMFLVDNLNKVIKPSTNNDLVSPASPLKIYVTSNNSGGNYRRPGGGSYAWNNGKFDFYVTYHFEATRLDAIETTITTLATKEEVAELEMGVNETISTLATKEEIAEFVTEEVVDQKIAAAEHHKPIFDLSRNVNKVTFDLSASSEPQIVTLTLSEGKVFAGQAVSSSQIISTSLGAINPGVDSTLSVNIGLQETPAESTTVFVIVDTICDSVDYDNAQHVAEVIPVEINVPAVSE